MIKQTLILFDAKVSRIMPLLPPLGLILGFFLPGVFIHLHPVVPWFLGLVTFSGAMGLRVSEFGDTIRNPLPMIIFFVFVRLIMPLYVLFFSSFIFSGDSDIIAGFILFYSGPSAISGFIWISAFRGDKALGLSLILLDTLLSPLIMPGTISILIGTRVAVNSSAIMSTLFFMVVIPTIIGVTLNETSRGKIPAQISPYLNPFIKTSLVLIIAANTSSVLSSIQLNDLKIWKIMGMCIFFLVSSLILAKLFASVFRISFEKIIGLAIPAGQRNMAAAITIATGFFPESVALPALINILFQHLVASLMGKLLFKQNKNTDAA